MLWKKKIDFLKRNRKERNQIRRKLNSLKKLRKRTKKKKEMRKRRRKKKYLMFLFKMIALSTNWLVLMFTLDQPTPVTTGLILILTEVLMNLMAKILTGREPKMIFGWSLMTLWSKTSTSVKLRMIALVLMKSQLVDLVLGTLVAEIMVKVDTCFSMSVNRRSQSRFWSPRKKSKSKKNRV